MALTGQHLQHLRTSGVTPPSSAITSMGELVISTNAEFGPRLWTLVGDGTKYAEFKSESAISAVTANSAITLSSFTAEEDTSLSPTAGKAVGIVGTKDGNKVTYELVDTIDKANSASTLSGFNVTAGAAGGTTGSVVKIIDKNNNVIRYTLTDTINSATTAASAAALDGFGVEENTEVTTSTNGMVLVGIGTNGNKVTYNFTGYINSAATAVSAQTVPASVIKTGETKLSTDSAGTGNVITNITVDDHKITFTKGIDVYSKTEVDAKVSSVYKVKGSKSTYAELIAITDAVVGDVWNVVAASGDTPAGTNYVYTGSGATAAEKWDPLGGTVDLSAYSKLSAITTNGDGVVTGGELTNSGVTLQLNRTTAIKVNSASTADNLEGFGVQKDDSITTTNSGFLIKAIGKNGNKVVYRYADSINSATTANSALTAATAQTVNGDNVNGTTLKNGAAVEYSGTTLAPASSSITQTLNEMHKGVIENEKVVSEALNTLNDKIDALSGGTISDIVTDGTATAPVASITKANGVVTLNKDAAVLVNSATTANSAETVTWTGLVSVPTPTYTISGVVTGSANATEVGDNVTISATAATATTIGSGATVAWGNVSGITGTAANTLATGNHTHTVTVQLSGATDSGIEVVGTGTNTSASPNVTVNISKLIIDCGTF